MNYILVTMMVLIYTMPFAMATGGGSPSLEQLYNASRQEKPVVELINKSPKKSEKLICYSIVAQNKVKEKPC